MKYWYIFLYCIVWPFVSFFHPNRGLGQGKIPEGGVLLCANHSRMIDPILLVFAIGLRMQVRPMAKAELMRVPVVGFLLRKAGVFGVERGKSDIGAIKQAMKYLKEGEKVLLFPEGTRQKDGEVGDGKTGAAMLAVRTGVPILPVYIQPEKRWFRRTHVVFGEPYTPEIAGKKGTTEEYHAIAADLMERIRLLGTQVKK